MALALRAGAAAIKRDPFPTKRPPRPDSLKRMLDGAHSYSNCNTDPNEKGDLALP
jgi:hypothetical protein